MSDTSQTNPRDIEATQIINMADFDKTITCPIDKVILSEDELKQKIIQPDWGKLKSSFTNLSVLGFGGMGTIFSAKDTLFYRNLALKIMRSDLKNDEKSIESFIREARITAQIDHPNIIPVYNLGIFEGTGAYFSMKKVDGETLDYVLHKLEKNDPEYQKKYSIHRRLEIFLNICNGMLFAHSKGIIHRDLKPANIMLGNYGEVFIMDWGMAVYIAANDSSNKREKIDLREEEITQKKNSISGTPLFMSPEQITGCEIEFGEQSDVYALGNILYCLLCCVATPYDPQLETKELFSKIINGEIVVPHKRSKSLKISRELEAITLKALEVDRDHRYKNVTELMNDIKNYLDLRVVGVYNSPIIRFFKFCRRHPLIPTTLLVSLLTVGVFFSYFAIKDTIEVNALKKILQQNIEESQSLLKQQQQLRQRYSRHNAQTDLEYIQLETLSQNTALLNEIKLSNSIRELLDTIGKISLLSNNNADISKERKIALKLIIDYGFGHIMDEYNLQKIMSSATDKLNAEFNELVKEIPQSKEQLKLLQTNKGKLKFHTDNEVELVYEGNNWKSLEQQDSTKKLIKTPCELELSAGTYIFHYKNKNMDTISIPIKIEPGIIYDYELDVIDNVPANTIFIHGGEYVSRILSQSDLGYKRNIDDFFLSKNEVTFGEYLEFWHSLSSEKERRDFTASRIVHTDNGLTVEPLWDKNGSLISPLTTQMPVFGVSPEAAEAFCKYMSKKLNRKCRLPYFGELEKAARGVDNRIYVWGNDFEKNYALLNSNSDKKDYPFGAAADFFQKDISVYGVQNLAGNLRELVKINGTDDYGLYGGSYLTDHSSARCSNITRFNGGANDVGFRYVIEMEK